MHFYQTERIALFIDGANLYATAKSLGFDIDYKRLLALFRQKGQLVRALYYTALAEDQEYSSIRPLIDWLDYNGFTMVTKPTKEFTDASGRRKIKGNMDIELAVDAMRLAENLDHIVCSPATAISAASSPPCSRWASASRVVSTLQTQPPMVADELRRQADQFVDLADLEQLICRDPATRPVREGRSFVVVAVAAAAIRRAKPAPSRIATTSPKRSNGRLGRWPPWGKHVHAGGSEAVRLVPTARRLSRREPAQGPRLVQRCRPVFRRRRRAPADRRSGTGAQRRQPHRAPLHRRLCR